MYFHPDIFACSSQPGIDFNISKNLLWDVNDLVALRLPAGIFMGTFVFISCGGELLHFPMVPFSGFIIVFVFVTSLYIL